MAQSMLEPHLVDLEIYFATQSILEPHLVNLKIYFAAQSSDIRAAVGKIRSMILPHVKIDG